MKTTLFILFVFPFFAFANDLKRYDLGNNIFLVLEEKTFMGKKHKITYCSDSKKTVCLIDKHIPFGIDGKLPQEEFSYITLQVKNKKYLLDSSQMYDAWGLRALGDDNIVDYFVASCYDASNCIARGLFSDGAGAFIAEWQIRSGISQRTVITNQSDLINTFIQDMHPPVYD